MFELRLLIARQRSERKRKLTVRSRSLPAARARSIPRELRRTKACGTVPRVPACETLAPSVRCGGEPVGPRSTVYARTPLLRPHVSSRAYLAEVSLLTLRTGCFVLLRLAERLALR